MRDADDCHQDPLACRALLYAAGELPDAEAAAFEKSLADDQCAREALIQAVQLVEPLRTGRAAIPDPAYRQRVSRRLGGRENVWQRVLGCRTYRGHPVLWAGLGAVAAAMLVLVLMPQPRPDLVAVAPMPSSPPTEGPLALPDDDPDAFDVARVWATIPNSDHLARAREDEMRRKGRAEDRARVGRGEDRRQRPLSNVNPKH